jgi:hypothetical protein
MSSSKFLTIINGVRSLVPAIAASAGAADANKVMMTGSDGKIDLSLMPTGVGPAVSTIVASEALSAGDFVNIFNNAGTPNVRKADASNNRPAHGFLLAAAAANANASVYRSGANTAVTGLTAGVDYYLSASMAGLSTAIAPSTAGQFIQVLGTATSSTQLYFEFDEPTSIVS